MLRSAAVTLAVFAACRPDHGPPRVKKLPKGDNTPALRGGGAPRSPRIASYALEARLDAVRHTIDGKAKLIWTNAGQSPVDVLPFHLYLNAFKNEQSVFMRASKGEVRGAKASDTGWGWIQIDSLMIGGVEQVAKLRYPNLPDETVVDASRLVASTLRSAAATTTRSPGPNTTSWSASTGRCSPPAMPRPVST